MSRPNFMTFFVLLSLTSVYNLTPLKPDDWQRLDSVYHTCVRQNTPSIRAMK